MKRRRWRESAPREKAVALVGCLFALAAWWLLYRDELERFLAQWRH